MKLLIRYSVAALLLLAVNFSAHAQKPTTPLGINDYFASINDTLFANGKAWGQQLNASMTSKDFSKLSVPRKKLETFIKNKQKELKAMKDVKGSQAFRLAMIDFLDLEMNMITKSFIPFEKFNKTTNPDDITKAAELLTALAGEEDAALAKIRETQNAYAASNGFTIESAPEEND